MGLFGKKQQGSMITGDGFLLPANAQPVFNAGPGTFQYNVVGESNYNANLRAVLKEEGIDAGVPGEFETTAMLLCEPRNQFDPNAVAVVVNTRRVGYIPKEDAKGLSPQLQQMAAGGQVLFVKAVLGWNDPMVIGVRLDLAVN
jgi:hypothetical protein